MTAGSSPVKTRAAAVSIASNSCLIVLKVAAGLVTGSVGILSDAVHSLMDLIASLIAWLLGPDGGWVTGQVLSPNGGAVRGR